MITILDEDGHDVTIDERAVEGITSHGRKRGKRRALIYMKSGEVHRSSMSVGQAITLVRGAEWSQRAGFDE